MEDKIKELQKLSIAYQAAQEYDRCPDSDDATDNMIDNIGFSSGQKEYSREMVIEALDENQGRRPDEIAGSIMNLIDQL